MNIKKDLFLRKLIDCPINIQLKIRDIRNQKNIREAMYNQSKIELNEHLNWIKNLKGNNNRIVFVVFLTEDEPLGVISIDDIDKVNKKASWAFYLDDSSKGGLGAVLEYNFLNYIFDYLNIEKLNCEVLEDNITVIKLHKKFNFSEEGYRRSQIIKDKSRLGVKLLGLTKRDWSEVRILIYEKYINFFDKYNFYIKDEIFKKDDILSLIEKTRSKNNVNWMALLRICVEKDPEISKPIIKQILTLDREISDLTAKLVKE